MPEPTLRRLPWYLAYLSMLKNRQVEYVSTTRMAEELAEAAHSHHQGVVA